jgi:hypothetical protein
MKSPFLLVNPPTAPFFFGDRGTQKNAVQCFQALGHGSLPSLRHQPKDLTGPQVAMENGHRNS